MSEHLVRRHRTWFVKTRVPVDLRAVLGKSVLRRTTGEHDRMRAQAVKAPILAAFREIIREARAGVASLAPEPVATARRDGELRQAIAAIWDIADSFS